MCWPEALVDGAVRTIGVMGRWRWSVWALAWRRCALPEGCKIGEDVGDVLIAQRRVREHAAPGCPSRMAPKADLLLSFKVCVARLRRSGLWR